MKTLLLVGLLLAPLTKVAAQEALSIISGTRVRILVRGGDQKQRPIRHMGPMRSVSYQYIGSVVTLDAETLVLKFQSGDTLAIPLASVTRLERDAHGFGRARGALIGGGIVALAGGIYGATQWAADEEEPDESGTLQVGFTLDDSRGCFFCISPFGAFFIGAIVIGLPSAVISAVASGKPWEPVPLPLQVGFSPHGGMRVALRFDFGK